MKDISDYFSSPTKSNTSKTALNMSPKLLGPEIPEPESNNRNNVKSKKKRSLSITKPKNTLKRSPSNVQKDEKVSKHKNKDKMKPKLQLNLNTFSNSSNSSNSLIHNGNIIENISGTTVEPALVTKSNKSLTKVILDEESDIRVTKNKEKRKSRLQLNSKTSNTSSADNSQSSNLTENSESISHKSDSQNINLTPSKIPVNAFQFLMDSRSNVIGQNTDGKELDDDSPSQKEEKKRLDERKNFLQDWAEKRGGAKRKRDEVEVEKCINKKLDKRAKRLKKMLKVENKKSTQLNEKRRNRVLIIDSSDSECSRLSNNQDISVNTNKSGVLPKIDEQDAQDKNIKTQKKSRKGKHVENFEGIFDRLNECVPRNDGDVNLDKGKTSVKIIKSKLCLKTDDENSKQDDKTMQKKNRKENKKEHPTDVEEKISNCNYGRNEDKLTPDKILAPATQNSVIKSRTPDCVKKPYKKKSRLSCLDHFCRPLDDSSQESQDLTPRTLKKWKLKIKLNNHNDVDDDNQKPEENELEDNEEKIITSPKGSSLKSDENSQKDDAELQNITINSSDSEDEKPLSEITEKSMKIAPVFSKAASKKLDEKTLEARRSFLMSGIPNSIRKTLDRQKSDEEKPLNVFPFISHVQQKCDHNFWNIPNTKLNLKNYETPNIDVSTLVCENLINKTDNSNPIQMQEKKKVHNVRATLNQIKQDNPDYPVFKAFRHISEKSGKVQNIEKTKSVKKRGRKPKKSMELQGNKTDTSCTKENEMWTEKYKPRCSGEILGNHNGVTKLKEWLETWMNYSEEINSRRGKNEYDSSSEFDTTDWDSRDSIRLPGNTVIVGGPNGSGKTSAIYAMANELGFNVLEVNASSKRTGKKLQQELQEATRSHQVRKKEIKSIFDLKNFDTKSTNKTDTDVKGEKKKMCILLVEDVDIIFEQDDGFLSSLTQLIATSKRPIILTTSDTGPNHIQKLLTQHEFISFTPLTLNILSVWLQLVCLVEGLLVNQHDLGNLLEFNKGDIRKTLLELQFWVQSGGQLDTEKVLPLLTADNSKNWEKQTNIDEELNISLNDDCDQNNRCYNFVHKNILGSFAVFKENKPFNVPKGVNFGTLWWNTPNIFNVDVSQRRHKSSKTENNSQQLEASNRSDNKTTLIRSLRYYDSLVTTDLLHTSLGHCGSAEPIVNDWFTELKDSLELNERMDEGDSRDFVNDVSHYLVDSCVEDFRKSGDFRGVNMALPNSTERRWRAKQHVCEDFLKEPLPLSSTLERRSVTLDYLPSLRNIARSEKNKSVLNSKRGNRFRHYFRNLNMDFNENVCKMVSDVLILDDS